MTIDFKWCYKNTESGEFEMKDISALAPLSINTIGELVKLIAYIDVPRPEIEFKDGEIIYFNPALFNPIFGSPVGISSYGYKVCYDTSLLGTGFFDMQLFGSTPINNLKNYTAKISLIDNRTAQITLTFLHTFDLMGFIQSLYCNNQTRLLRQKYDDTQDFEVSTGTVYDTIKRAVFWLYTEYNDPVNGLITRSAYCQINYSAEFWNPIGKYFNTPIFNFTVEGADTNGKLCLTKDINFKFTITGDPLQGRFCCGFIRTDTVDDTTDFVTNYEASYCQIPTNTGTTTIDNKLKAPSIAPYVGGSNYSAEITIDHALLTAGAKYRAYVVCYKETVAGTVDEVFSFISDELPVTYVPPIACHLNYAGNIYDYRNTFLGNSTEDSAPAERIKSELKIEYSLDRLKDLLLNNLGITGTNDIRDILSKITVEVSYEETTGNGLERHIYERKTFSKVGGYAYILPTDGTMAADAIYTDAAIFSIITRLRYEQDINVLESYYNGVLQPLPTLPMAMMGKEIFIDWYFTFDYPQPAILQTETVLFRQKIDVETVDRTGNNEIVFLSDCNIPIIGIPTYCPDDEICVQNLIHHEIGHCYSLIGAVVKPNYDIGQLFEEESWPGNAELAEFDNDIIIDIDDVFTDLGTGVYQGNLQIDGHQLTVGELYYLICINKECECVEPPAPFFNVALQMIDSVNYLVITPGLAPYETFRFWIWTVQGGVQLMPKIFTDIVDPSYQVSLADLVGYVVAGDTMYDIQIFCEYTLNGCYTESLTNVQVVCTGGFCSITNILPDTILARVPNTNGTQDGTAYIGGDLIIRMKNYITNIHYDMVGADFDELQVDCNTGDEAKYSIDGNGDLIYTP